MSKRPSERALRKVHQTLRGKPGAQQRVSDGVYMRLDRSGRRRFLARVRVGGALLGSRTYDIWDEAEQARQELAASQTTSTGDPTPEQMRGWLVERYADEAWWKLHVLIHCDDQTQIDYGHGLDGLLPLVRGVRMEDLVKSPMLIDRIRAAAKASKTYAKDGDGEARFHPAAADRIIATLRRICTHAVKGRVLPFNPLLGGPKFNKPRRAGQSGKGGGEHRLLESEIYHPKMVALVGVGMRGNPLTLLRRRLIPWLIATGMRPSDILAMRDFWWRDKNGPRGLIHIDSAVKDLAGHLIEGEPKTGERDLRLFPVIAEWLEAIYQLKGASGDLEALTFPNKWGDLLDWGNWRQQVWYPALHRGGIIDQPAADARGAFYPYRLRHAGVSTMLHADRPEGGTYSRHEVAEQFGHTVGTLDRVYGTVLPDLHGVAGMTMNEIIRGAMADVWGPLPGDPDHEIVEYDLLEAVPLTGISNKALAARIQNGSIPGVKREGRYYVTEFDLRWHGLLPRLAQ